MFPATIQPLMFQEEFLSTPSTVDNVFQANNAYMRPRALAGKKIYLLVIFF